MLYSLVYVPRPTAGPLFTKKTPSYGYRIPIIKLRRSDDRLRFIMGIPILIGRRLRSEYRPCRKYIEVFQQVGASADLYGFERSNLVSYLVALAYGYTNGDNKESTVGVTYILAFVILRIIQALGNWKFAKPDICVNEKLKTGAWIIPTHGPNKPI